MSSGTSLKPKCVEGPAPPLGEDVEDEDAGDDACGSSGLVGCVQHLVEHEKERTACLAADRVDRNISRERNRRVVTLAAKSLRDRLRDT